MGLRSRADILCTFTQRLVSTLTAPDTFVSGVNIRLYHHVIFIPLSALTPVQSGQSVA